MRATIISTVGKFAIALLSGVFAASLVAAGGTERRRSKAQARTIEAAAVRVLGPGGAEHVGLESRATGGKVRVLDVNGTERLTAAVESGDPHLGGISVRSIEGVTVARLGTIIPRGARPASHAGNLDLRDLQGRDRIRLSVSDDGTPSMELLDAAGNVTWSAR